VVALPLRENTQSIATITSEGLDNSVCGLPARARRHFKAALSGTPKPAIHCQIYGLSAGSI
jgi:hypothetical protein